MAETTTRLGRRLVSEARPIRKFQKSAQTVDEEGRFDDDDRQKSQCVIEEETEGEVRRERQRHFWTDLHK